jgi:hypothetical protein
MPVRIAEAAASTGSLRMAASFSPMGILHTAISLIPVFVGAWALLRDGRIDPRAGIGKVYLWAMLASIFSAAGLSSTGGFNEAHALGVLTLLVLAVGYNTHRMRFLGGLADYVQVLALSFSYMLLYIPAINETLKRVPPSQPLATGPDSPIVLALVGVVVTAFAIGASWQVLRLRAARRQPATAGA